MSTKDFTVRMRTINPSNPDTYLARSFSGDEEVFLGDEAAIRACALAQVGKFQSDVAEQYKALGDVEYRIVLWSGVEFDNWKVYGREDEDEWRSFD